MVKKRSGARELFDLAKVIRGVEAACKGRPVSPSEITDLAVAVEDEVRAVRDGCSTQQVGLAVLERLRSVDHVAYLRFASVYKGFDNAGDFARELALLDPHV